MRKKTISGHYDKVFSLSHNNRLFTPKNVDPSRTPWNYNCISAGLPFPADKELLQYLDEYWRTYRILSELYWSERAVSRALQEESFQQYLARMRKYRQMQYDLSSDPIVSFFCLLLTPVFLPCQIYLQYQNHQARQELAALKEEQWLQDMTFNAYKQSFREALKEHDTKTGSKYLQTLDSLVSDMAFAAEDYLHVKPQQDLTPAKEHRFATLEEIYDKLYEPVFREFQNKQRPCRRYNGTYLEQIREQQAKEKVKKQQTKNAKSHSIAEAIEIAFGIGDMDNTGYIAAYQDAKQSEALLKDFCDHLLTLPKAKLSCWCISKDGAGTGCEYRSAATRASAILTI